MAWECLECKRFVPSTLEVCKCGYSSVTKQSVKEVEKIKSDKAKEASVLIVELKTKSEIEKKVIGALEQTNTFNCPKCNSEIIKSIPLVYNEGIQNVSLTSNVTMMNFSGSGGISIGTAASGGQMSSMLTGKIAPPDLIKILKNDLESRKNSSIVIFFVFHFLLLFVSADIYAKTNEPAIFIFLFITLPIGLWLLFSFINKKIEPKRIDRKNYLRQYYEEALKIWQNSFLCQRCGNVFLKV
ncbi:MAG: hypothetical protein HQK88_15410 [Nitrospirae bacterium]|nr:hypothetical protein [Nitrospirota bacterium]MBF0536187.1 hypothetical protein [Nitrospirota bacterium]MBF0618189.1 hypothetical protein [Nitrospirota bacterium]